MADETAAYDFARRKAQQAVEMTPVLVLHYDEVRNGPRAKRAPSGKLLLRFASVTATEQGDAAGLHPALVGFCLGDAMTTGALRTGMWPSAAVAVLARVDAWLNTDEALDKMTAYWSQGSGE